MPTAIFTLNEGNDQIKPRLKFDIDSAYFQVTFAEVKVKVPSSKILLNSSTETEIWGLDWAYNLKSTQRNLIEFLHNVNYTILYQNIRFQVWIVFDFCRKLIMLR